MSTSAAAPGLYGFFGRGGLLEQAHPGYEYRPGQLEMAETVAKALAQHRHLLVEAGTGVGKTLAYLLPVLHSGRRVLISTGTRNLQEQLIAKDVPLLGEALGRPVDAVCVKGRQNYACRHKIQELAAQPTLLGLDELEQYGKLRRWVETTETGDQAELEFLPENAPLWQRLNARRETCTGQKCPLFESCFVTRLHQRASEAELVVVNHHLFFADLALKRRQTPGVLPDYEAVIFDEAHELESIAGQYFGVAVSSHQIEDVARDVAVTLRMLGLGTPELAERTELARISAQNFFMVLGAQEGRHPFVNRAEFLSEHVNIYESCMNALLFLRSGLESIPEKPEEIHNLMRRLEELKTRLAYVLESEEEGVVYWIERRGRGVIAQASPVDVAELLREMLFQEVDTAILTSATLTVEGEFGYVRERLGLEHADEKTVASPFHYPEQGLLYLAGHLPAPQTPAYAAAAVEEIEKLLLASRGRAFVLCTSVAQMRHFHRELSSRMDFPMLLQGTAPRHLLLERFRGTPHAVLFATSSFWQGVDVQGEQLSCVIVDRLPFASPGDPLVQARIAALREQGRNPFAEFQVPEAVLTLKQGCGRLIRSASDRGVVALLDSRVVTKPYGRMFLRSLPNFTQTSRIEDVQNFFTADRF